MGHRSDPSRPTLAGAGKIHDAWQQTRHLEGTGSDARAPGHRALERPAGLAAVPGAALIQLTWDPVPQAVGYLIERAEAADGPWRVVDHGGGDVLAVPGPAYADTTGLVGRTYWYRVRPLGTKEGAAGEPSVAVAGASGHRPAPPMAVTVHADRGAPRIQPVWHMLGSEHLSQLGYTDTTGGRVIGTEFHEALFMARQELGLEYVRAHGILSDVRPLHPEWPDGGAYDFSAVDDLYQAVLALGIRPVVELSFMPAHLARHPEAAVFTYPGVASPPQDPARWGQLIEAFARHLVDRFGLEEVAAWAFEVWNEPNLSVFWQGGSLADYLQLYGQAARALRRVSRRLRIGGPATAAAEWLESLLAYVRHEGLPLDFLSTHTYGNLPLSVRPLLERHGLDATQVWWTEWGVTPTHFHPVNDLAFGAPFVLHGMKSAQTRADWLAYWVVSDHFEELGRPPRLWHGGFGLLTVGNLRKPRYWALALAESLGTDAREVELVGDGAGTLVDAWATRHDDGKVDLLVWNGTLDQSKQAGYPLLDRRLKIRVEGMARSPRHARLARVDERHSNIAGVYRQAMGFAALPDWPDPAAWDRLRELDRLSEAEIAVDWENGAVSVVVDLPMPGVARLRLEP